MAAAEERFAARRSARPLPPKEPRQLDASIGVGLVLLSALAFASTPALVRLAYTAHINNVSLVAFRCLIAAGLLWLVARLFRERAATRSRRWRLVLLGALLFAPQMWAYFAALQSLDTSITVAIVYTYPALVVALIALQMRKAPSLAEILLLALALCGVGAIVLSGPIMEGSTRGLMLAALTAAGYALYVVAAGAAVGDTPPLSAASLVLAGAGMSSVVYGILTGVLALPSTGAGVGLLALHGLLIVPVGLASYFAGLKRLGAGVTSLVDTSQPAIATMIGVVILGEHLAPAQGLGIAAIVLAVVGLPVLSVLQTRRGQGRMHAVSSHGQHDAQFRRPSGNMFGQQCARQRRRGKSDR